MKKYILIIFAILVCNNLVFAAEPVDISAECACVVELKTGHILFSKNENTRHAMASTTKIMTALIALEESNPDDIVQMSAVAANTDGSSIYMEAGEKIHMNDLLYGLMLNSGNDAAVAIAEHISGNIKSFCDKMNKKAREIGAHDTCFKNPSGLYEEGHFTTAKDLAEITRYAMKNEIFREIVKSKTKTVTLVDTNRELYFGNHNKMLWNYNGTIGVKTGYTKDTGRCLVSAAQRNGTTLIAVTLDAPNDWNDHKQLLDYGFSKTVNKLVIEKEQVMKTVEINGKHCDFIASSECVMATEQGKDSGVVVNVKIPNKLTGPFEKGEKVGVVEIVYDGEILDTVDIVSKDAVYTEQKNELITDKNENFFEKLLNIILKFFLYT